VKVYKKKQIIAFSILLFAASAVLAVVGYAQGIIYPAYPDTAKTPCLGVDVSHYQGDIDWAAAGKAGVDFAYIKASEGEGYADPAYQTNSGGCVQAGIPYGAYHFFRFDREGAKQAEFLLKTAPYAQGMLPYAVDVEFTGNTGDYET
jgi:lysozyme